MQVVAGIVLPWVHNLGKASDELFHRAAPALDCTQRFQPCPLRRNACVQAPAPYAIALTRTSLVSTNIAWLQERHAWPGLAAIGRVVRAREVSATISTETAYYLLSTPLSAERFGEAARAHWGVENGLHWVLDVTMNEDQARNRLDYGPQNIALLRRLALNLAKLEGSKESMKGKPMRAAWDDTFLTRLLAQFGKIQMR